MSKLPENYQRCAKIAQMRKAGFTYREIGSRFGISATRVSQICRNYERRYAILSAPLGKLLHDAQKTLSPQVNLSVIMRACTALKRIGVIEPSQLASVKLADFANMRNVGAKTLALVALAKEAVDV